MGNKHALSPSARLGHRQFQEAAQQLGTQLASMDALARDKIQSSFAEESVMPGTDIKQHPIHLGLGARAVVEPEFTGSMDWYADYVARHSDDGIEARLVSVHVFTQSWAQWEMHPKGSEVVLCLSGRMTLLQEKPDGKAVSVDLGPGEYAINEAGTWHTADVDGEASALFITAGVGTEHRPR